MTTVYVSGPMTGYPQLNEPAFRRAARLLQDEGYHAVVPHDLAVIEHDGACPPSYGESTGEHTGPCYLRADLVHMLLYCDELYVLRGWRESRGASLEVHVAHQLHMPLRFEGSDDVADVVQER